MVKKRTDDEEAGQAGQASEASEELTELVEDETGREIWTVGTWGDLPQWRCALCTWDTLDGERAMAAHYLAVHAPPAPPAPPAIVQVYDRYGRPV
jgi:hypothetical protein